MADPTETARAAIALAETTHRAASDAKDAMAARLAEAARAFIYPGRVVDLRDFRALEECFVNVKTRRGNDRGTRVFRIESFPRVEVNATHPILSSWRCDATPISEKTGKAMSGSSHGADSRDTVEIGAHLVCDPYNDLTGDASHVAANEHLLAFVAKAHAALPSPALSDEAPAPFKKSPKP